MTSHQDATATAEHKTGVRDEVYNIVSVLYYALQDGNGHEAHHGMEAGTQSHGMTGSQAHGHSRQGQEQQEHRR